MGPDDIHDGGVAGSGNARGGDDGVGQGGVVALADGPDAAVHAELERAHAARARQVRDELAPATRDAYTGDWQRFETWCERMARIDPSIRACPADDATLSLWIGASDHLAVPTIRRRLAAVRFVHERRGHPLADDALPATLAAIAGHRRTRREAPVRQATAATDDLIRAMADACDVDTPQGLRDRALLLLGWDGALRRSELVGIDHEHLARRRDVLLVRLPASKGDPTGRGAEVPVLARPGSPWCPVAALGAWVQASSRTTGPLFVSLHGARHVRTPGTQRLSGRAVARITAAAAKRAGLDGDFSGHSLRRGLASTALEADVPLEQVARHLRHRHVQTTLGYARARDATLAHPRVGLVVAAATASVRAPTELVRTPDDAVSGAPALPPPDASSDDADTGCPAQSRDP